MRLVDLSSNNSLGLNRWLFRSLNNVAFQELLLVGRFWTSRGVWTTETLLRNQNEKGYKLTLNVKDAAVILTAARQITEENCFPIHESLLMVIGLKAIYSGQWLFKERYHNLPQSVINIVISAMCLETNINRLHKIIMGHWEMFSQSYHRLSLDAESCSVPSTPTMLVKARKLWED